MAYIPQTSTLDEEQKKKDEASNLLTTSAAGGVLQGQTAPVSAQQTQLGGGAAAQTGRSGSFTNLQKYLETNQPQASELATKVAGGVTAAGEAAKTALQQTGANTASQIQSGTNVYDQSLMQKATSAPTTLTSEERDRLTTMGSGTFRGPETFNIETAQPTIDTAQQKATATETATGRSQLLKEMPSATGRVTPGRVGLDQFLLQNLQGPQDILKQASEAARAGITETTAGQKAATEKAIAEAKQKTFETGQQTRGEVGTAFAGAEEEIAAQTAATRKTALEQASTISQKLKVAAELTPAELSDLGITQDQYDSIRAQKAQAAKDYGSDVDLTSYFRQDNPEVAIQAQNVASQQQAARYQALRDLAGQFGTDISKGPILQQALGTVNPTDIVGFDIANAMSSSQGILQAGKAAAEQKRMNDAQIAANAQIQAQNEQAIRDQQAAQKKQSTISTIGTVVGIVASIFCLTKDTWVRMADGTNKCITDIQVGDEVELGGIVGGVGKILTSDFYRYDDSFTSTGIHCMFEEGKWTRVYDSPKAVKLDIEADFIYPLVTQNHCFIANGHIHRDVIEHDDAHLLNIHQRLEIFNSDEDELSKFRAVETRLRIEQMVDQIQLDLDLKPTQPKGLSVRTYNDIHDYEMIAKWMKGLGWKDATDRDLLPKDGLVVINQDGTAIAAGFVYVSGGDKVVFPTSIVTNPSLNVITRTKALKYLMKSIVEMCESITNYDGYIYALPDTSAMDRIYSEMGFIDGGTVNVRVLPINRTTYGWLVADQDGSK